MCENWLNVLLVHHFSAKDHFLGFVQTRGSKKGKKVRSTLCVLVMAYLKVPNRNNIVFNNEMSDVEEVFNLIQDKS